MLGPCRAVPKSRPDHQSRGVCLGCALPPQRLQEIKATRPSFPCLILKGRARVFVCTYGLDSVFLWLFGLLINNFASETWLFTFHPLFRGKLVSLMEALATSFTAICLQVHTLIKEYTYSETKERNKLHRFHTSNVLIWNVETLPWRSAVQSSSLYLLILPKQSWYIEKLKHTTSQNLQRKDENKITTLHSNSIQPYLYRILYIQW